MGTLKMSLPEAPSLQTSKLPLLLIITVLSKGLSNVPSLVISGVGLEGLDISCHKRLYAILSCPVSNQRVYHGWARRKMFNIRVPRLLKRAILGLFVVNRTKKAYSNKERKK